MDVAHLWRHSRLDGHSSLGVWLMLCAAWHAVHLDRGEWQRCKVCGCCQHSQGRLPGQDMPAVLGTFSCTCTVFPCTLLSRDPANSKREAQDALLTGLLCSVCALSCMTSWRVIFTELLAHLACALEAQSVAWLRFRCVSGDCYYSWQGASGGGWHWS